MKSLVVVAVAAMVMFFSTSAAYAEKSEKGWFVYGIYDHNTFDLTLDRFDPITLAPVKVNVEARRSLFGIGVEKSFNRKFVRKLGIEYLTGTASATEPGESTRERGRYIFRAKGEFHLGKGWTLIPTYEQNNGFVSGQRQSIKTVRFGKRF